MARRTLALVLGAIATGGASGDIPSFHRPWIPDLDQLRATGGGFFGLPGTGDGYSAPAAAANLMVYIDRHGYTNMVPALTSGESLYADHAYREATTLLFNLGTSMSTGAVANGTLPFYVARGLRNRIEDQYPQGKFIVVHKDSTNADPVGPDDFAQVHSLGGMSIMYFRVHAQHISGTWLPVGGGFRTVTSVVGGRDRRIQGAVPIGSQSHVRRHADFARSVSVPRIWVEPWRLPHRREWTAARRPPALGTDRPW